MENKLSNDEIAKVFAMYYGCTVICPFDNTRSKLDIIDKAIPSLAAEGVLKLELIPLSKISDEDAIEVAKIVGYGDIEDLAPMGRRYILRMYKEGCADCFTIQVHEYMKMKDYAIPLFFGVGHWANGKTAIGLGIAIDATNNL